jgi:hypothetical protein
VSAATEPYLGYRDGDHDTPWAPFYDEALAPLHPHVAFAVTTGALAPPLFTSVEDVGAMAEGDEPVETGFAVHPDGSITVNALTPMPGVTPAMWDWWFGWHGCDDRRYKLWHPRAHLSAQWADGGDDIAYVGRTSHVVEYLGSTLAHAAIRFVPPAELGLDLPDGEVAICARTGSSQHPVDLGWLVHHVRPTEGGSEMRSRFWLGGRHTAPRRPNPVLDRVVPPVANRMVGLDARAASALLVHCAQEMAHLAARLPALHERFS